jgi:hypothetical protein
MRGRWLFTLRNDRSEASKICAKQLQMSEELHDSLEVPAQWCTQIIRRN